MAIFDVMGPIMIGPSSSHTAGAAKIGYLARCVYGKPVQHVRITLYNSFAETGRGHGTHMALLAGILGLHVDDARIRHSFALAREQGATVTFEEVLDPEKHPNTAVITFTDAGDRHPFVVEGISVGGGAVKIVGINGTRVDFSGKHNLLLVAYADVPGMMGIIGDRLAERGVNIAYAQISRDRNTRAAMAIMKLDQPCPDAVAAELKADHHVTDVVTIPRLGVEYERTEED